MRKIRVVKRDPESASRKPVETAEPSPMIPLEKREYRFALRAEGDKLYMAISEGDEIRGYEFRYGSDELKEALRSPFVLIGKRTVEEISKGMLLRSTLEELKRFRGALAASSKRVKDRGILDGLPYLVPRVTLEDLKNVHGIIVTDKPVDFDALIISSDGEPARPKEDVATRILEALIEAHGIVQEDMTHDLRVALNEYHLGRGEEFLEVVSLEVPLERVPEVVRRMRSLGLRAIPKALVARIKDRLKADIESLLAALAIYEALAERVERLVERISGNATGILLKAPEEKSREARRKLRDLVPEIASEAAKELLLRGEISDGFARELVSVAKLSREDALRVLSRAEKLKRIRTAAELARLVKPTPEEIKSLKRSPEFTLSVARELKSEGVALYHRLLETRLAEEAAKDMVSLGLVDEALKTRLMRFSKRNPLKAADIASGDKGLFKRLVDSIYAELDSAKFSILLAEHAELIETDRLEERIPKRLENHEPSERLIDVVTRKNAIRSAEALADFRARNERRELVNRIVEGLERKHARRIVDRVTVPELLSTLALKPHLARKRFLEGLLSGDKFESILANVAQALSFDELLELVRSKRLSDEGVKIVLEEAVRKADTRKRVIELANFAAELKLRERILPRIASQAKLLKPEPSAEFVEALRTLGTLFGVNYAKERYAEIRELSKKRKHPYVGRLLVLADPGNFESKRPELGEVSEFLEPDVQILVPRATKTLALQGKLKPAYPFEVLRYAGKLPEYLSRLARGERVKLDAKSVSSVGELRYIASAISRVRGKRPIELAHAAAALRILARGDAEFAEIYKRLLSESSVRRPLEEVDVKLPPGFFGGKAKAFARDAELQLAIIKHALEAPYLEVYEDGYKALDSQRSVEVRREKKKLRVRVKRLG